MTTLINTTGTGKVPLHNTDLEEAVLGAVLIDFKTIDTVVTKLQPEDFYKPIHADIFKVFQKMFSAGKGIDLFTANNEIKKNNIEVDPMLLIEISSKVASTYNIETHIKELINLSQKRKAVQLGYNLINKGYDITTAGNEDLSEIIKDAEKGLSRSVAKETKSYKEIFIDTVRNIEKNEGKPLGIPTGFNYIDKNNSGLTAPDLTIVAASPGEGKSIFALNIAQFVSQNFGEVLFFSLEMKAEQIIYRLLSNQADRSVNDIRQGNFSKELEIYQKLYEAKLNIFDNGSLGIDELVSICKYEASKKPVKLIVVDYLQLLGLGIYKTKGSNRNNDIGIISRKLKELAMDLNIPIIALSQVNRDKLRKEYRLSDLRESGSIEQDADNVYFIFRPVLHSMSEYSFKGEIKPVSVESTIIQIGKCRLGSIGQFELKFNGKCSRFENVKPL